MTDPKFNFACVDDLLNTIEGDIQKHDLPIEDVALMWKTALRNMLIIRSYTDKQKVQHG
jgi:hypothetical protein